MADTIVELLRTLSGQEDEIRTLAASDANFAALTERYGQLCREIDAARAALPDEIAARGELLRQRAKLLDAISACLIEEEENIDDRRMI